MAADSDQTVGHLQPADAADSSGVVGAVDHIDFVALPWFVGCVVSIDAVEEREVVVDVGLKGSGGVIGGWALGAAAYHDENYQYCAEPLDHVVAALGDEESCIQHVASAD